MRLVAMSIACTAALVWNSPVTAKKRKADLTLSGCWMSTKPGFQLEMCFGRDNRVRTSSTSLRYREGAYAFGQYRRIGDAELQIVGFPGDGWISSSALVTCSYSIGNDQLTLSGCDLAGSWSQSCGKVDANLECRH